MKFIRALKTNVKIYACVAIVAILGAAQTSWLLAELSEANAIAAQLDYSLTRSWAIAFLVLGSSVATILAIWLAAEVTRPIRVAVQAAQRIAAGDLSTRVEQEGGDESGLLLRAMQEMNDKLIAMIVNVRTGSETISSCAGEIASGNMDLSTRTEQQASSLEETASSMEELTSTVKQNAEHAHQASKLAVSASEVAVKGGEVVSEVVGTMASINDSSKRIAEIIGVIDSIAFQTNILALNAAVEAARAGEQGRGFAVVAAEVRSLAQRSAAAAKEIKELIDDSVEKVSAGTQLADKAGNTMNDVVASVKRVTEIIGEIAAASAEQTTGIEQINQAISGMDQATQQNAALVEESAAAAASMRDQAGSLKRLISGFLLDAAHARPTAQIHLVASNPGKASGPRGDAAKHLKPVPNPTPAAREAATAANGGGKRATAAKADLDWKEF